MSGQLPPLALAPFMAEEGREYSLDDLPPPFYRQVEAPPCGDLLPVPPVPQDFDGLPPEVDCHLPAGHDGNHVHVWDAWEGTAMGWRR